MDNNPVHTPYTVINKTEVIILAGGLGTRLREAVPDLPKCMAPVAGRPFLYHVINYFRNQGIERFVFSLGYKHEVIETYLQTAFATLTYKIVVESEPLGTGGAIHLACHAAQSDTVIVVNGDTLFRVNVAELLSFHTGKHAACTLALKPMKDFNRYGVVETDPDGTVTSFLEKKDYREGFINGGVYVIDRKTFASHSFPEKFSFEKDYLEKYYQQGNIYAVPQEGYFIDIGIPEDFQRAQTELAMPPLDLKKIDKTWSLFLDRDGVINEDKPGSYIFSPDEFIFMEGAPALFKKLSSVFGRIFIATNQRGVGRQLMTEDTLTQIHEKLQSAVKTAGGQLDAIYYATGIHNNDPYRKPNPGMAVRARREFPAIDPAKCIMIGNNLSDMEFGRNAGMYTIFLTTTSPDVTLPHPDIDLIYSLLEDFAKAL